MLILILIDVQHSRKAVFSFEKGSNYQNHSSSSSLYSVKKSPPVKFLIPPTPYSYLENPDSWHSPFLIVKKVKHWNLDITAYLVIGAICQIEKDPALSPSPPNSSKDSKKYCPCLYLSVGQVWWLNELWFKRYIQKCTQSQILIVIMISQIWQMRRWLKIQKLEYLRTKYFSTKKKNS